MMQNTPSTRTQIARTNAAFAEAFRRGDSAEMVAIYTTDAQIMPPNGEMRRGKLSSC